MISNSKTKFKNMKEMIDGVVLLEILNHYNSDIFANDFYSVWKSKLKSNMVNLKFLSYTVDKANSILGKILKEPFKLNIDKLKVGDTFEFGSFLNFLIFFLVIESSICEI